MQILLLKKISTAFLHQNLQMNLELFHKNKTKPRKKINSVNGLLGHQRLFTETYTKSYQGAMSGKRVNSCVSLCVGHQLVNSSYYNGVAEKTKLWGCKGTCNVQHHMYTHSAAQPLQLKVKNQF